MVRLELFDGVTHLPMSKVWTYLENLSSFSAIKLDIWAHKTGHSQGFEVHSRRRGMAQDVGIVS